MTVTLRLFALLLGFGLDLLLGDPSWLPHPIRAIGALIAALEKALRRLFPKRQGGELAGGAALVILVLALSGGFTLLVLWLCGQVGLWLRFLAETVLCYQLLATRSLKGESMKVYKALKAGDLEGARYAVSMIVGRDTQCLDEAGRAGLLHGAPPPEWIADFVFRHFRGVVIDWVLNRGSYRLADKLRQDYRFFEGAFRSGGPAQQPEGAAHP